MEGLFPYKQSKIEQTLKLCLKGGEGCFCRLRLLNLKVQENEVCSGLVHVYYVYQGESRRAVGYFGQGQVNFASLFVHILTKA